MSRHRGAKPSRRCGLLGKISLAAGSLEPGFPSARLVGLAVKPAYALALKRVVADHPEQTLRAPPLHFRRRPPQSNYPPDTVPRPDHGAGLGCQNVEGGIPRATPQRLASLVHCLPPILYTTDRQPMSSCSKGSRGLSVLPRVSRIFTTSAISPGQRPMPSCSEGSRGLSVLPRVIRIFTNNTISPGPWLRQRPNRYTIRAGRNLPDKEFRYLRTVIVTAAVYRGLASELRLAADPSA